jgi:hypothetical protein
MVNAIWINELEWRKGKISTLFAKVHYTQTGCLGKYAAERSKNT